MQCLRRYGCQLLATSTEKVMRGRVFESSGQWSRPMYITLIGLNDCPGLIYVQ